MEAVGATVTHRTRVGQARAVSCKRRVGAHDLQGGRPRCCFSKRDDGPARNFSRCHRPFSEVRSF